MSKKRTNIESIDDEVEYLSSVRTQQHLSFAQARGIILLFNYYFREKDNNGRTRRLPRAEKDRRWKLYKTKVYQDYNRLVRGTFNSEAALVKRYSNPMSFLKYRLKRHTNLKVADLSPQDQDYYHEIGGVDDIEEMFRRQANIDSIGRAAKRQRLDDFDGEETVDTEYSRNHNVASPRFNPSSQPERHPGQSRNQSQPNLSIQPPSFYYKNQYPPALSQTTNTTSLAAKPEAPTSNLHTALTEINQNLNDLEKEQLLKKKTLTLELTKDKTKAFISVFQDEFTHKPELLGIFPNIIKKEIVMSLINNCVFLEQSSNLQGSFLNNLLHFD